MKKLSIYFVILCAVLTLPFLKGCEKSDSEISATTGIPDIGYEGFKSDAELFHEFAYRKESLILNALNYTSDGFTKAPFEGKVSNAEFELFFLELEEMNKKSKQHEQAIKRLEESGVLQRPTQTRGLFTSTKDFFTWISGSGERNRNRITTIASNMNAAERSKLYNDLRPEWKEKASSEADFWNKLENGDYDSSAGQMYNDFYHDTETDFSSLAQEKGLTPQKIVVNEGAKGIEAGANLALDAASAVAPGFGTGMTVVKVSDNVEKMAKSESWKEAAEHGFNAAGDILEEVTGNIGYTGFNGGDVVNVIRNKVHSSIFKQDDKNETKGKIKIKDKNPEKSKSVVIIQKEGGGDNNDGSPSTYVGAKNEKSSEVEIPVKAGNWMVTVVNEKGLRETTKVKVEKGKECVAEVNTQEAKEEEDETVQVKKLDFKASRISLSFEETNDSPRKVSTDVTGYGIPIEKATGTTTYGKSTIHYNSSSEETIVKYNTYTLYYKWDITLELDAQAKKILKGVANQTKINRPNYNLSKMDKGETTSISFENVPLFGSGVNKYTFFVYKEKNGPMSNFISSVYYKHFIDDQSVVEVKSWKKDTDYSFMIELYLELID